jgi:Piwi domain
VEVRFADMAEVGAETFPVRRLVDPEYSFDRSGGKYARRVDDGLKRFGPYDAQLMRGQSLRLLVVALEEHKGEVEIAIQKLLKGIQAKPQVFTGLTAMYRLDNLEVSYAWAKMAPGAPMKRYADALHQALQSAPSGTTPRFHLLLTVINASHHDLPDSENSYFQTKVIALIQDHVPTQAITIEKLRQANYDLQYILNTMALALYAKLGGTSHVLKLPTIDADVPTELVFGIGRSMRRTGRFDEGYETVGFATVFRANGEYLYNSATPYCDDVHYERALEDTIRRTIETVAAYEGLPEDAPLRLIFHVPRRPGRREERPILNAVGKLAKFKIEFALVHVNDDHHLHLFDTANIAPKTLRGQQKPEAMLLPPRGFAVTVGPRERLVTFIGVDQYRGYGCPAPLRITLDARSTFRDIDYVTQQLYLLSFMSAGSLNPGKAPATITYAEQLADLTGHLRGVQNWTVELIHQYLGRKLWFI